MRTQTRARRASPNCSSLTSVSEVAQTRFSGSAAFRRLTTENRGFRPGYSVWFNTIPLLLGLRILAGAALLLLLTPATETSRAVAWESARLGADQPEVFLYVALDGNDAWSGRYAEPNAQRTDGPFHTIARARDAIRALKAGGKFVSPITVWVRSGVYALNEPLVFKPEDSGIPGKPIVYSAYPGEGPVLSGGRAVTGWSGPGEAVGKASGVKASDQISGPGQPRPIWATRLPEVEAGEWYFREVFVNGQRRQRARSPNTGFFFSDGQISADDLARFKFRNQDIRAAWAEEGDVEVVALMKWAEMRLPIKSVDEATHTVTLAQKRQEWGDERDVRYWVENSYEALDAPGEWFLRRRDGMLFYWMLPGDDLTANPVIAPRLQQLVRLEGDAEAGQLVHDLTLRGFTFAYTDWSMPANGYVDMQAAYNLPAAVEMIGARNCSLEKCLFTHLGQYAVEIHKGSKGNRVVGNEMTDLGAGGVRIGDPKIPSGELEATSGNLVSDNHIHNMGVVYPAAVGVWIGQSSGNTISHNEINDTYYTAISAGWTWGYGPTAAHDNVLEFNSLHDIGRGMLSDMGCIYTLGVQPGTVERNNLCHDVTRYVHGYGGWGLYTDEGSSNIVLENNVVYRAEDGGFHQHYGRENLVRNNIFAFGKTAEIRRTRQEPHLSFTFERNIVYWDQGALLDGNWEGNNYRFDNNLYFRTGGQAFEFGKRSLAEWQRAGQDAHSLVADPLFTDPENADFTLKPGSPAAKIGFQPIDLTQVGPRH